MISDKLHTAAVVRHTRQQELCFENLEKLWSDYDILGFLYRFQHDPTFITDRARAEMCMRNFLVIVDTLINEEVEYGFLPQLRDIVRIYWAKFYGHYILDDFTNIDDLREFECLVAKFRSEFRKSLDAIWSPVPKKRFSEKLRLSLRRFRRKVVPRKVATFCYDYLY